MSFKRHVKIHLVETGKGRGSEELRGLDLSEKAVFSEAIVFMCVSQATAV